MGFCYTPRIRGVFWCHPIFRRSDQSECDVDRFGISRSGRLLLLPPQAGIGGPSSKNHDFLEVFVFNIAHNCTLTKRNGRGVVYNISGNKKINKYFNSEFILEKNMKIHPKTWFRVHTPLLGLSWAISGKRLILEILHDFLKVLFF